MRVKLALMIIGMAVFISPSLRADTFDFGSCAQITTSGAVCPNADSTKTQLTYSNGVLSVVATGELLGGGTTNLYVKQGGTDETGLGTTIDGDNEINTSEFINFDLSNLVANNIFSGVFTFGSAQAGEGYEVCQGNTVGALGGGCMTGGAGLISPTLDLSWTSSTDIIGITAWDSDGQHTAANILVTGLNLNQNVPEPSTLVLLSSGLIGLALLSWKRATNWQTRQTSF